MVFVPWKTSGLMVRLYVLILSDTRFRVEGLGFRVDDKHPVSFQV